MQDDSVQLQVIICSTRPGRVGPAIAEWFVDTAASLTDFKVELVDLKRFELPIFDEPNHPRLGEYVHEHTRRWSESVSRAKAFVFVTPEYNHAPPPSLVNALDYLSNEWKYKPAGFVSYGGISGGIRAVQVARQMVTALRMVPCLDALPIPNVQKQMRQDGSFAADELQTQAVFPLLQELRRLALMASFSGDARVLPPRS